MINVHLGFIPPNCLRNTVLATIGKNARICLLSFEDHWKVISKNFYYRFVFPFMCTLVYLQLLEQ